MAIKFTDARVKQFDHPDKGQKFEWDSGLVGLGVRLTPTKATYIVQGRCNGKGCRVTIGSTFLYRLVDVKPEASQLLISMAKGVNPNEVRQGEIAKAKQVDQEKSETVRFMLEKMITEKGTKTSTAKGMRDLLNRHVPEWMDAPIGDITEDDVRDAHSRIKTTRTHSQADHSLRILGTVINYWITGTATRRKQAGEPPIENPVLILNRLKLKQKERPKTRVVDPVQMASWWTASGKLQSESSRDLLRLLALTGMRFSEGANLTRSDVDLKLMTITISDTKTGEELIFPMGTWLSEMVAGRIALGKDNLFVSKYGKQLTDVRSAIRKMVEYGAPAFSPHDLRRTFITSGLALGLGDIAVKKLVNHTVAGVTAGYTHLNREQLRAVAQKIEDHWLKDIDHSEGGYVATRQPEGRPIIDRTINDMEAVFGLMSGGTSKDDALAFIVDLRIKQLKIDPDDKEHVNSVRGHLLASYQKFRPTMDQWEAMHNGMNSDLTNGLTLGYILLSDDQEYFDPRDRTKKL